MGHVSDFKGVTSEHQSDLTQTSDLISAENLLDLPLNENFMPIYTSFPDDIYRQPHLYASNNLTSFMNNDDDRNEYFDEPLELDLFLDSSFNIDFDPSEAILENNSNTNSQNHTKGIKVEANLNGKSESTIHIEENVAGCTSCQVLPHSESQHQNQEYHVNDNFNSAASDEKKKYSAAAVFSELESSENNNEHLPKIVIKLKSESQTDQHVPYADNSSISSSVQSSSKNNENFTFETVKIKVKDKHKHKKHKKKSRHKKKHSLNSGKDKIHKRNSSLSDGVTNCTTESFVNENLSLNKSTDIDIHTNNSKMHMLNNCPSDDNSRESSYVDRNFETNDNYYMFHNIKPEPLDEEIDEKITESLNKSNYMFHNIKTEPLDEEIDEKITESLNKSNYMFHNIKTEPLDEEINEKISESLNKSNYMFHNIKTEPLDDEISENVTETLDPPDSDNIESEPMCDDTMQNGSSEPLDDEVDFQFEFENSDELSLSPDISIEKDRDETVDNFLREIDASPIENIPCKLVVETVKTIESIESDDYNGYLRKELPSEIENASTALNNESNKSSSASDLIEELNAHHQQVFEEIEVSTTELELNINDEKDIDMHPKTSHQTHVSANDHIINQNKISMKHGENDMNSQNHISPNKISSPSHVLTLTSNLHNSTSRLRSTSSSSNSVNCKSSTSHRSYRKKRRSSSSSSSCSEKETFYNRPAKFDPVTQTYCDEFGREIRPSELKYYLNLKSNLRDSHSNNGSSSSSRSKSPRYKSYHRKHHKSRSGSRSHRRRRYSSSRSRSRSRSRDRRHKDNFDRKYRSPSPKHRNKRHYLDVEENMRAYEERRVMYVGDIPPDYTVEQLKERFSRFGPIQTASIKSKFTADGSLYIFGFVTFKNRSDVCEAIERGNENPSWPRFDLNFGGRRRFCNGNYTDLDGKVAEAESGWYQTSYRQQPKQEDDFAELLRQEQRRLGMSKK